MVVIPRHADQIGQLGACHLVVLEQIPVVDPGDPRLWVDVERADPLVLRRDALTGLQRCAIPLEVPLPADDGPLDEGCRERDEVGDELVERIRPATLSELVFDPGLHPINAVLSRLQNLEPELLSHGLFELCQLSPVGRLSRGLQDLHDALSEGQLQFFRVLGGEIRDRCGG